MTRRRRSNKSKRKKPAPAAGVFEPVSEEEPAFEKGPFSPDICYGGGEGEGAYLGNRQATGSFEEEAQIDTDVEGVCEKENGVGVEGDVDEVDGEVVRTRKGKGKKKGRGRKKKQAVEPNSGEKFKIDDTLTVNAIVQQTEDALKGVEVCAERYLAPLCRRLAEEKTSELRRERNAALKAYHRVAVEAVETRLKSLNLAEIVQRVYEETDVVNRTNLEEDDVECFKLIEEFGEACMKKVEEEGEKITMDEVDQDEGYQDCLELLNQFFERTKISDDSAAAPPDIKVEVEDEDVKVFSDEMKHPPEDLEVVGGYIPIHDPITKQLFSDPYVNRICGHVYEFVTAVQLIQTRNFRCPYAGCSNLNVVMMSDLRKDEGLEKKIADEIRMFNDFFVDDY